MTVSHGVIVGRIVEATAERLQFADGTEFAISGWLALPSLTSGAIVKLVYQIANGLKIPVGVTVLPDRR